MLVLIACLSLLAVVAVAVGMSVRLRVLDERIRTLERRLSERPTPPLPQSQPSPLAGLRVSIDVAQDHPHPVFANLLKEALLQEDASPLLSGGEERGEGRLSISGNLLCNGYADVYYRAELAVQRGEETLFVLAEKPPHGDRPENLAIEIVARLRAEWAKHERQSAIRELRG